MSIPARSGGMILERFLDVASRHPDNVALCFDNQHLTYAALRRAAAQLSDRLAQDSVQSGDVVGVLANRGPDLIVAMIASLMRGAAFVIFDAGYPDERLETLIDLAVPKRIVLATENPADTQRGLKIAGRRSIAPPACGWWRAEPSITDAPAAVNPAETPGHSDIAYYLFTSGTTGVPKCIANGPVPLAHFVDWQIATFRLTADDRFVLLSGIAHDPILRDIFTPLGLGASIHIPRQADLLDPVQLARWWHGTNPTVCHLTPQMGSLLAASLGAHGASSLRLAFWGGDKLHATLSRRFRECAPAAEQVNFYGSTETPQAAAFHRIDPAVEQDGVVAIGTGIADFELHVLRDDGWPAPIGEIGQVAVESPYLSLGYMIDGTLHPYDKGGRVYLTGDLGRRYPDGSVTVVGRRDDQIKIRGYRVELGEIASVILNTPGVTEAVCLPYHAPENTRIVGFVTSNSSENTLRDEIYARIKRKLPNYMIPDRIIFLDRLPLLPNNKVNRQDLLAMIPTGSDPGSGLCDQDMANPDEARLIQAWREVFGRSDITPNSTFSSLDGDSLNYVMAYLAVEECVGNVPTDWVGQPIRDLVARLPSAQHAGPRIFTGVDSAMLARACAIIAIVATHVQILTVNIGSTTALLFVSGHLFGRIQLRESILRRSVAPIAKAALSVFSVTAIYTLLAFVFGLLRHKTMSLSTMLMVNDFVDYDAIQKSGYIDWGARYIHLWYIHGILHTMLFLVALFYISLRFKLIEKFKVQSAMAVLGLAFAARWAWPILSAVSTGQTEVGETALLRWLPTSNFATFFLGAMIGAALFESKSVARLIVAAYALASAPYFGTATSLMFFVVGLMIVEYEKVAVPRFLVQLIYMLSGASLFIYLGHISVAFTMYPVLARVLGPGGPVDLLLASPASKVVELIVTVAICMAAWRAWNILQRGVSGFAHRIWSARRRRDAYPGAALEAY